LRLQEHDKRREASYKNSFHRPLRSGLRSERLGSQKYSKDVSVLSRVMKGKRDLNVPCSVVQGLLGGLREFLKSHLERSTGL